MASNLTNNSLIINGTQQVTGVSTVLNENDTELPTSATFIKFLKEKGILSPVLNQFEISGSGLTTLTFID